VNVRSPWELGRATLAAIGLALTACGGAAPALRTEEPAEETPRPYVVALRLEEAAEAEDGTPETRVSLVRITPDGDRTIEALRTEPGACFLEPAAGALIAARCWWAGQSASYRVQREGDAVIALRSVSEESERVEVARLEIPGDAELQVLAPGQALSLPGGARPRRAPE
jgi:hypothetical protein